MSYNPTTWNTGDIVTSEKLNKMEQGIANAGVLVCNVVEDNETYRLDHTWQEIVDAGFAVLRTDNGGIAMLVETDIDAVAFVHIQNGAITPHIFTCSSPDDYPHADDSNSGGGGNSGPSL